MLTSTPRLSQYSTPATSLRARFLKLRKPFGVAARLPVSDGPWIGQMGMGERASLGGSSSSCILISLSLRVAFGPHASSQSIRAASQALPADPQNGTNSPHPAMRLDAFPPLFLRPLSSSRKFMSSCCANLRRERGKCANEASPCCAPPPL